MKPSTEDMHSVMEVEDGVEPHDVFVDLGVLIVEGRIPGGQWATGRGYGEGPHCAGVGLAAAAAGGARHICDPGNSFLCKRAENFRKHMQLLWQNSIPMCIEVLLCPDCPCGAQKAQNPDVANIPASSAMLLEQWMITMITKRCPDMPQISVRGLFQAVRSQLHFSQLSAWWSSSKGSKPTHISYRVTVPGEAFASQFQRPPIEHSFPVAGVGRNTAIKVLVRTLPRMEAVPQLTCVLHPGGEQQKQKREVDLPMGPGAGSEVFTKPNIEEHSQWGMGNERGADPLLGASLLDPPQSLDLFGRRYQSPSRGSSPSMEAPERLMFGCGMVRQAVSSGCGLMVRWRDNSPPSPPLSTHQHRLGRQGLARRRDTNTASGSSICTEVTWTNPADVQNAPTHVLPGLVDDRMQNPCTRPGKHHCRCAYDDDSETLPLGTPAPAPFLVDQQHQRCTPEPSTEQVQNISSSPSKPPGGKKSPQVPPCSKPCKVISLPSCSNRAAESSAKLKPHENLLASLEVPAKDSIDKKLVEGEDKAAGKFNLELSPREFEEVLAVLRDRSGPPRSFTQGSTKELEIASEMGHLTSKLCCDARSPPSSSKSQCELMYNAPTTSASSKSLASSSHKADLLMDAILRTSGNHHDNVFTKTGINKNENLSSVLAVKCKQSRDNCDSSESDIANHVSLVRDNSCSDGTKSEKPCMTLHKTEKWTRSGTLKGDDRILKDRTSSTITNVVTTSLPSVIKQEKVTNIFLQTASNTATIPKQITPENRNNDISEKNHNSKCLSLPPTTTKSKETNSKLDVPLRTSSGDGKIKKSVVLKAEDGISQHNAVDCSQDQIEQKNPVPKLQNPALRRLGQLKESHRKEIENGEVNTSERPVPSAQDKAKFRRSLDSAASMVFHCRTGLPLTSSPAPVRRGTTCFDFDSSLNSVSAIRSALFESATVTVLDDTLSLSSDDTESEGSARSPCSPGVGLTFPAAGSSPWTCCYNPSPCSSLLGSFEESVLNGRLEPVSTVQGFTADLGASGSFCPRHLVLPVTVFFYTLGDNDKVSTPYLGHINLGKKGYSVPRCGTIQVTLLNPLGTVVKMFVVMYDLSDMPVNSQTFLRQRTLYMPANPATVDGQPDNPQKYLRYLIHLRFCSSKSGRIYLHTDIRMIIFRKSDFDTATAHGLDMSYELRSFTHGPTNPKFSPRK